MNYIINPMFFYLANICETIKVISLVLFIVSGVALIFMAFFIFNEYAYCDEDDKEYKLLKKWTKIVGIALTISLTLLLFVPSEETLYKMQLAKLTTIENVDKTFEYIDKAVDKILEQK